MVFRRFRIVCAGRVLLLTLTILGAVLLAPGRPGGAAALAAAAVLQAYSLIRYVERVNRDLARFFLSIQYADSGQSFKDEGLGRSFRDLRAAMSGVMWGLVISTLAPREEQAMLMVIIVVVVQMVFSGGLVALSEVGPIGQGIGAVTSSKWAFQALATATQVKAGDCALNLADCRLPGIQQYGTDPERVAYLRPIEQRFGDVFGEEVIVAWLAMAAIIAGLFVVLYVLQKRKDVI